MKNIISDLKNDYFFKEEYLMEYLKQRIKEEDLYDQIDIASILYDDVTCYDPETKSISINPKEIILKCKKSSKWLVGLDDIVSNKERKTGKMKSMNIINFYNLHAINHELRHAYQSSINKNNIRLWYEAFLKINDYATWIDSKYFFNYFYDTFHDYFFAEYDANVYGYIQTLNFLNSLGITSIEKELEKFNMYIAKNLFYSYKSMNSKKLDSTPVMNNIQIYTYLKNFLKQQDIKVSGINRIRKSSDKLPDKQYDRIKLGLSLKKETLKHIQDVSKGKEKTLNLFDDIKNIR